MKKQKWINTRFAEPYKQRLAWAAIKSVIILHNGIALLSQIRSTKADTTEQKINKKLAMANAVLQTHQSVTDTVKEVRKI